MIADPIIVVHGISNRSPADFAETVGKLQERIGTHHALVEFFWGDLGGISQGLADTLPTLWPSSNRQETRSTQAAAQIIAARALAGRALSTGLSEVRSAPAVQERIAAAVASATHLRYIEDLESLYAVGDLLHDAIELSQPGLTVAKGGLGAAFSGDGLVETRALDFVGRMVAHVDQLVGRLTNGIGGTFNQLLRNKLAVPIALTLGDIVGYHQNRRQIHERLMQLLDDRTPGWGTAERPVNVMAHSLGGLLVLDAVLGAELERKLHIRRLVTFGSQPAFFHVMTPRKGIPSYSGTGRVQLPTGSIGNWTNLWHPLDALAFLAGSVFELGEDRGPIDLEVPTPGSEIVERRGWMHSVYWESSLLAAQWKEQAP